MGVGGQRHTPAALSPGKTRHTLYRRLDGAPGPVWTDAENLAPTGIRSPDRPARGQSLYRHRLLTLRAVTGLVALSDVDVSNVKNTSEWESSETFQ